MRSVVLLTLILLIAACSRTTDSPRADVVALLARTGSIDSLARSSPDIERHFALAGGRLVPVSDSSAWPQEAEAEVRVLLAQDGRPLRHIEVPVSGSGDWYAEHAHYFDETGRTVAIRDYVGYIVDECGGSGSITRRTVYGPPFQVLWTETSNTDATGADREPAECEGRVDLLAGMPRESYAAFVLAGQAPER